MDWEWISQCQELPEGFIHQYADLVDWYEIYINQKLSEEFIIYCDGGDCVDTEAVTLNGDSFCVLKK